MQLAAIQHLVGAVSLALNTFCYSTKFTIQNLCEIKISESTNKRGHVTCHSGYSGPSVIRTIWDQHLSV